MMRFSQSLYSLFVAVLLCLPACGGGSDVECDDANPCEGGYLCMRGVCEKVCAAADDCEPGEACLNQTCQAYEQTCGEDTPCAQGFYCADGECEALGRLGEVCSDAEGCVSGLCVDGVCCSSACDGPCEACEASLTGEATGVCHPVVVGADPDEECAGALACDGGGACFAGEEGAVCSENYECISEFCVDGYCSPPPCGDGVLGVGEDCDDGNTVDDGNGCSEACTANNTCGDGVIEDAIEVCDDGNSDAGDYCGADCREVTGSCGDGETQTNEDCDDGNTTDDGDGCSEACLANSVCGNGSLESLTETCDDGNTDDGDYCSADCSEIIGACGDSTVQTNEDCDDGNAIDDGNGCSAVCVSNAFCGNGSVESLYEDCDDGNQVEDGNGCGSSCERLGACGDGAVESYFEVCDDNNTTDGDYCSADCSSVTGTCGDGTVQSNEACDDGNTSNGDYCSDDCMLSYGSCGDGVVQFFEGCDDGGVLPGNGCNELCEVEPGWVCTGTLSSCTRVVYVKQAAFGSGSGDSWENATTSLQTGLELAQAALDASSTVSSVEVWVASGTYYPTHELVPGEARSATFQLIPGVALFGGFDGFEFERRDRTISTNDTILSGDIDQNGSKSGNAYHVVNGSFGDDTAILDGFIVEEGSASSSCSSCDDVSGGGLFMDGGSPRIANTVFRSNEAGGSFGYGGAMAIYGGAEPVFINLLIHGNEAQNGAAIRLHNSQPHFYNTTVTDNLSVTPGGAAILRSGGEIGVYNSIIANNDGSLLTNQFNSISANDTILSSIVSGISENSSLGTVDADPLFVDPSAQDYRLQAGSPAVDSGSYLILSSFGDPWDTDGNNAVVGAFPWDVSGQERIEGAQVDMGAHELR